VRLKWSRSKFDAPGQPVTITGYAVFREQGQNKAGRDAGRSLPGQGTPAAGGVRMEGWDYVMTVPAFGDSTYQCVAPTLCDSTITDGLCLSNFLIRATTSNPFDYYDSAPMSGYSVDNLAPSAPSNLRFQGPSTLVWDEVADPDFRFYAIYQSGNPVFDPQDTDLLGYSTTPAMDVSGAHERYLHVTATDFSGNEGRAGTISNPATDVAAGGAPPTRYALHAARPNPATESVVMGFDLPQAEDVWLRVFDVTGREAATLARGRFPAGVHTVIWDTREQGAQLPTGAYFCRLSAGSYSETQKVLQVRRQEHAGTTGCIRGLSTHRPAAALREAQRADHGVHVLLTRSGEALRSAGKGWWTPARRCHRGQPHAPHGAPA
jgi:hypothetical protein